MKKLVITLLSLSILIACKRIARPCENIIINKTTSKLVSFAVNSATMLSPDNRYALNAKVPNLKLNEIIEACFWRFGNEPKLRLNGDTKHFYHFENYLPDTITKDGWQRVSFRAQVTPEMVGDTMAIYAHYLGWSKIPVLNMQVKRYCNVVINDKDTLPNYQFNSVLWALVEDISNQPSHVNPDSLAVYASLPLLDTICHKLACSANEFRNTLTKKLKTASSQILYTQLVVLVGKQAYLPQSTVADSSMIIRTLAGYTNQIFYQLNDTVNIHITNGFDYLSSIDLYAINNDYSFQFIKHLGKEFNNKLLAKEIGIGLFAIRLSAGKSFFDIPIGINDTTKNKVLILAPVTTWFAYNHYAGQSLYRNILDKNPVYYANTNKPLTSIDWTGQKDGHDFVALKNIYDWFNSRYGATIYPDFYLETHPELLKGFRTIVLAQHAEYFSATMYQNLKNLATDANFINLGGNQIYWKIEWARDYQTFECRKDLTFFNNGQPGGLWSGLVNSEASLTGVAYKGMVEPAVYRVVNPTHFLFQGTTILKGDSFGLKGINGKAICDDETDGIRPTSPPNTVLLAVGNNANNRGGEIVYVPRGRLGTLATGAITSGNGLGYDKVFTKMIENFMLRHNQ